MNVAAFLDGSTFVLGAEDQVKAAIDRWIGGGTPSNALTQKAVEVSATADAWAVATSISEYTGGAASTTPVPPQVTQQAAIAQTIASKIDIISGGLAFGDTNVVVRGEVLTKTAQDAQALADIFQLFVTMAGSQVTQSPLFNGLQVAPKGAALNFTLTLTEQQAEDLVKPKSSTTAASRGAVLE